MVFKAICMNGILYILTSMTALIASWMRKKTTHLWSLLHTYRLSCLPVFLFGSFIASIVHSSRPPSSLWGCLYEWYYRLHKTLQTIFELHEYSFHKMWAKRAHCQPNTWCFDTKYSNNPPRLLPSARYWEEWNDNDIVAIANSNKTFVSCAYVCYGFGYPTRRVMSFSFYLGEKVMRKR